MEDTSILRSVKDYCNISEDEDSFDNELMLHINTAFVALSHLGVGPDIPYRITGEENEWTEFDIASDNLPMVKSYVYLKTRLSFDSPSNSTLASSMKELLAEYEWRLNLMEDHSYDSSG